MLTYDDNGYDDDPPHDLFGDSWMYRPERSVQEIVAEQEHARKERELTDTIRKDRKTRKTSRKTFKMQKRARKLGLTLEELQQGIDEGKISPPGGWPRSKVSDKPKGTSLVLVGSSNTTKGGSKVHGYGVKQTITPIAVIDAERKIKSIWWWEGASIHLLSRYERAFGMVKWTDEKGEEEEIYCVPEDKAIFRPAGKKKSASPCAFVASQGYLAFLGLGALDTDDRAWYNEHPLTNEAGLPMAYTPRVLQELIEPYGARICRIRARVGVHIGDELRDWAHVLGMNPLAFGDQGTTNEEFARLTQQSVEAVNSRFRFDYSDVPLQPSIIFEADLNSKSVIPHGHASFAGPRKRLSADKIWLSVQYERKEAVRWNRDPQFPELPPSPEQVELDVWAVANQHAPAIISATGPVPTPEAAPFPRNPSVLPWHHADVVAARRPPGGTFGPVAKFCALCWGSPKSSGALCRDCWNAIWKGFTCQCLTRDRTVCKHNFSLVAPVYDSLTSDKISGRCPSCKGETYIGRDDTRATDMGFLLRLVFSTANWGLTEKECGWARFYLGYIADNIKDIQAHV